MGSETKRENLLPIFVQQWEKVLLLPLARDHFTERVLRAEQSAISNADIAFVRDREGEILRVRPGALLKCQRLGIWKSLTRVRGSARGMEMSGFINSCIYI